MKCSTLPAEQEAAARQLVSDCLHREGFEEIGSDKLLSRCSLEDSLVVATVTVHLVPAEALRHTPGALLHAASVVSQEEHPLIVAAPAASLKHTPPDEDSCDFIFEGLKLCHGQRNLWINSTAVPLTLREYQLLYYLMAHKNLVLTRAQIIGAVWELGYRGDTRTVDTHVKCLRAKLGPYGHCIQTLRKVGYRFCWE